MNRTHWQWGYRSALMDVFYGRPMVDAANRPEDLSADFVSGALAARERCDELTEMCDTDPLEYARAMGGTTWECADAAASMEAMAAWDRLVAAKDESRQIAEEGVLDQPCALEIAADAQAKCDTLRERVRALRRVIGMAENDLMCAADALKKHAEGIPVVLPFSAAEYAVDAARKCRKVLSATESEASK